MQNVYIEQSKDNNKLHENCDETVNVRQMH